MSRNIRPATEKQMKYIKSIAWTLGIDYDKSMDITEARDFISEHIDEFKAKRKQNYLRHLRHSFESRTSVSRSCNEDPFQGPHGSEIVDCFDYGIYPWGNS